MDEAVEEPEEVEDWSLLCTRLAAVIELLEWSLPITEIPSYDF